MITDEEYNPTSDPEKEESVLYNKILSDEEFNPSETVENEEAEEIDEITIPKDKEDDITPKIEVI